MRRARIVRGPPRRWRSSPRPRAGEPTDLVARPHSWVLVSQRVERMRVGREDLLELGLAKCLDIVLGEHLEQTLFASPAHIVSRVAIRLVHQAEIDAGVAQDPCENPRILLKPFVEAGEVTDEP